MNTYKVAILLTIESPNTADEVEAAISGGALTIGTKIYYYCGKHGDTTTKITERHISIWDLSSQQSQS